MFCFSTWRAATTHPQWGDNFLEWAVFWAIDRPGVGGPLPGLCDLQIWPPPDFFPWGFMKDEVYYVSAMPITLNNFEYEQRWQKLIRLYCEMFGTKSNIVLMCAGQQIEQMLKFHRKWIKNFLSCPLHGCEFSFCLANTFLPINLCNRSHRL
jgi:hypothetical protein